MSCALDKTDPITYMVWHSLNSKSLKLNRSMAFSDFSVGACRLPLQDSHTLYLPQTIFCNLGGHMHFPLTKPALGACIAVLALPLSTSPRGSDWGQEAVACLLRPCTLPWSHRYRPCKGSEGVHPDFDRTLCVWHCPPPQKSSRRDCASKKAPAHNQLAKGSIP